MKAIKIKLSNLAALYEELGTGAFFAFCIHKALSRVGKKNAFQYYHFYSQPIGPSQAHNPKRTSAFTFTWHESFSPLMLQLPRPEHRLRDRFKQKTTCVLGAKGGQLVSCAWFAYEGYEEDEVWCRYEFPNSPDSVWDYDVFVAPDYRLGRAFHLTWQAAASRLYNAGYRRTLSRISAYNPNSLRSHERLGAQRCGSAMYLRLGRIQIMASNKAPYLQITANRKGRPVLNFD